MRTKPAPESKARELLSRLLRGDAEAFSRPLPWEELDLLTVAARHRVHLLLAHQLQARGAFEQCPEDIREALQTAVREAALIERVQAIELQENLNRLAGANIHPLLLKGVPLAYRCYATPYLRPHLDSDLFIRKDDTESVRQVMEQAGYRSLVAIEGDRIQHQFYYERSRNEAITYPYDFHWRVLNPEVFGDLIPFESAAEASVAIPQLGSHARALGDVHALLLACVHRVAHHYDASNLLWLFDIHLLAPRLSDMAWEEFQILAAKSGTRTICKGALESAVAAYKTQVPAKVIENLSGAEGEASAAFLAADLRQIDVQVSNFKKLHGWRARWEFVRQNLFPDSRYMLAKYKVSNRVWLPALYLHRICRGAPRWFRSARNTG